jgi:hypothetical protein
LLLETETEWAKEEFGVGPGSPFTGVERVGDFVFLLASELSENILGCPNNIFNWNALVFDLEKPGNDFAC